MLLKGYTKEIFRPECNPGFQSVHCIARLEQDITEVLPYLNAVLGGFEYFEDPPAVTKSRFKLGVKAFVRVPITVIPRFVILRGKADQELSLNVKIEAGLEKPLQIEADRSRLEGRVRYEIREVEKGRSYVVRFTSVPGKPGRFLRRGAVLPERGPGPGADGHGLPECEGPHQRLDAVAGGGPAHRRGGPGRFRESCFL